MKKIFSIVIVLALALTLCLSLVACNQVADNTKFYDKVTKTLKLTKDYEGKSFLNDGIGKATVDSHTDGDTTRFKLAQGNIVIVRYYQVDTPESTGNVDKWGRAASNFTKDALNAATEIVLEATASVAQTDNYGTRYLGYVWYKTADYKEFKCLNLELVENGFSYNKGDSTSKYPYNDYFTKAESFARSIKLRMFSALADPLYSTDPVPMTVKEFLDNTDKFFNTDTNSGAKVRVVACLTSLRISDTDTYLFKAMEYDPETGKTYEINVYTGYSTSPASKMEIGHLYDIIGNIQKFNGSFQISGITYNELLELKDATTVKQENYYLKFDSSVEYSVHYYSTLYGDVTITDTSLNGNTLTIEGTAQQRKSGDTFKDEAETFTFTVKVADNYTNTFDVGDKISVSGIQLVEDSGAITIIDYKDIVKK